MLTIKILVALAALGLGIWLGLPGRYDQTLEDIEQNMERGARHHRKVKRHFTPLAWIQRQVSARSRRGHTRRRGFHLESPEDR
ncbi:MAG: hypothetical protein PVJ02_06815 [Gemmatimonadota bacterium]|jgi:hypothetical protein